MSQFSFSLGRSHSSCRRAALLLALGLLSWTGSPRVALGQDARGADRPSAGSLAASEPTALQSEELGEILSTLREDARKARRWDVAFNVSSGLVLAGFAGWRLIADPGANELALGLGVLFTGFAALNLARGFTALAHPQLEEELSHRFDVARESGLSEADMARFEGELFATARARWRERRVDRWFGFARAIGGALVAGLMPLTNTNRSTRLSGYVVGGLFFAVGMVEFGRSFKMSAAEQAWDDYQRLQ